MMPIVHRGSGSVTMFKPLLDCLVESPRVEMSTYVYSMDGSDASLSYSDTTGQTVQICLQLQPLPDGQVLISDKTETSDPKTDLSAQQALKQFDELLMKCAKRLGFKLS